METNIEFLGIIDWLLTPAVLLLIFLISLKIKRKNIGKNPAYRYYISGLFLKIFGGIVICLVYVFYYKGGDTLSYYAGGLAFAKLLLLNPSKYFSILFGFQSENIYSVFNNFTGYPEYFITIQPKTFAVCKITSIFLMPVGGAYIPATILMAWASYTGVWRLYLVFCDLLPSLIKQFAWAVLFMPSVVFWGSGMLKDNITLAASCWLTFCIYRLAIKKVNFLSNIIGIIITSVLMITIKPYIFIALMPGAIFWLSYEKIMRIKNKILRVLIFPMGLLAAIGIIISVFNIVGGNLGEYSNVDKMIEKAAINKEDMLRAEQYGSNYFDIGELDPSVGGMLKKAPVAILAALYRPFIWEARNVQSAISALENTFLLIFTIYILMKVGPVRTLKYTGTTPILAFSLFFSVLFAFSVGISTPNFGALVRYKIPAIPFFVSSLFILRYYYLLNRPKTGKRRNRIFSMMKSKK